MPKTSDPGDAITPRSPTDPTRTESPAYAISLKVNGAAVTREVAADRRLVEFIRDDVGLTGTKIGCEVGFCGVCSVLVDGRPVASCHTLAVQVDGTEVLTVEGISAAPRGPALQRAFIEEGGFQCGYCTAGQLVMATAALSGDDAAELTSSEMKERMAGTLCRCTGYYGILRALDRVRR